MEIELRQRDQDSQKILFDARWINFGRLNSHFGAIIGGDFAINISYVIV